MNILLIIPAIVWLCISVYFFGIGEYLSKIWGMKPSLHFALIYVLFSALSGLTWLPALLHKNQIAIMGTIWLLLATIATITVGVFVFHERITTIEWIGLILALISLALLGFYNPQ